MKLVIVAEVTGDQTTDDVESWAPSVAKLVSDVTGGAASFAVSAPELIGGLSVADAARAVEDNLTALLFRGTVVTPDTDGLETAGEE